MIDYLNPHHVYIDTQAAPDLSMNVKMDDTDAEKGIELMENRINTLYGTPDETPAERIIRLYRSGLSHVDIAGRGYDLADVRRVISEGTAKDETLYPMHRRMQACEHIVQLYRSGLSHVDIAGRGYDLADVRRVISEGTAKDETLYQTHKGLESRWSKRSAEGEQ